MKTIALVLFVLFASTGCAASTSRELLRDNAGSSQVSDGTDCAVSIVAGNSRGRGAILGPHTIVTVAHVVGDRREVDVAAGAVTWAHGHVAARIGASPEDLIVIELDVESSGFLSFDGFAKDRFSLLGGRRPSIILSQDGAHEWGQNLRKGDSGSPILDENGRLCGLLVGRRGEQAVFAAAPVQAFERVLAAKP